MIKALITLRKKAAKLSVLSFRRTDGSVTWSELHNLPVEHDLAHYAVESTLGFTQGFYGLLDQGYAPGDFELSRPERPPALLPRNLPLQAHQAEHLAGLLQLELFEGHFPNFTDDLARILASNGIAYPTGLNDKQLARMRTTYRNLVEQWRALPAGEQLELPFCL